MPRRVKPSPAEFAAIAKSRADQALQRYESLGDHWHADPPSLAAAADVAVDIAIGLEASLKCIADQHGLREKEDGPRAIFTSLSKAGRLPPAIANARVAYAASIETLFEARNAYLHGGLPPVDAVVLLGAVKDALHLHLVFASYDAVLGSQWSDLDDALWRFGGQPKHFATQVRNLFAGRRFENVPLYAQVTRFTGGSAFSIGGALTAVTEVEQTRWDWSGSAGSISKFLPSVQAEVGMLTPPLSDEMKKAPGEKIVDGTLQVLVRDLPVRAGGFSSDENPLAAPIYLFADHGRAWMAGPGDLLLARLHIEVPYRAKVKWFVTPDERLEAISELLELERVGALEGELRFHYPGHRGYPAFRGVAMMTGTTTASYPGFQVAEWRNVRWDPETGVVHSWWWEGVSKLSARWKMVATIAFDDVEVFE